MFFSDYNIKRSMSLTQAAIYQGIAFRTFHTFTVPASGEYLISVRNGENAIHLFSRLIKANLPDLVYEVRTGATITGYLGNPITIFNMNAFSQQITANVAQECTVSDYGTLTDIHQLGGDDLPGNNYDRGDESIDPEDIKILPNDTEFLLRITNPNTENANALLYLKWFETAPKN